jgi:hypothetical protein
MMTEFLREGWKVVSMDGFAGCEKHILSSMLGTGT